MDELWADDLDWENELDQLIQDAHDSDYAYDGYKDGNDGSRNLKDTLTLVFCSIASVLHFVCLILILLLCKGVIRIIYATRLAILDLASLSQIALMAAYTESMTLNHDENYITPSLGTALGTMPLWSMFCSIIVHSSFVIEETLPLILLHELYMCTSKMEIRERRTSMLIKKISITVVFVVACLSAHQILHQFFFYGMDSNNMLKVVLASPMTFQPAVSVVSTGFVIYYGSQILISLNKSRQFRDNCSQTQSDNKNRLLSTLVVLNIFAKSLKLAIRVLEIVLMAISAYIVNCLSEEDISQDCFKEWFDMIDLNLYPLLVHFSLLEFFWILFKMLGRPS